MPAEEAMRQYIALLFKLKPNWRERKFEELRRVHPVTSGGGERDEFGLLPEEREPEESLRGGGEKQFGAIFSTPARKADKELDLEYSPLLR